MQLGTVKQLDHVATFQLNINLSGSRANKAAELIRLAAARRQKDLVTLMLVLHIIGKGAHQGFARKVPCRANLTAFQDHAVAPVVVVVPASLMPMQRAENILAQCCNLRL
ncbi:Uncharacterised protein [Klebsiella pneumoniae]|nr:Uncharacterised protein [Klebsiella pneumoniae]